MWSVLQADIFLSPSQELILRMQTVLGHISVWWLLPCFYFSGFHYFCHQQNVLLNIYLLLELSFLICLMCFFLLKSESRRGIAGSLTPAVNLMLPVTGLNFLVCSSDFIDAILKSPRFKSPLLWSLDNAHLGSTIAIVKLCSAKHRSHSAGCGCPQVDYVKPKEPGYLLTA